MIYTYGSKNIISSSNVPSMPYARQLFYKQDMFMYSKFVITIKTFIWQIVCMSTGEY